MRVHVRVAFSLAGLLLASGLAGAVSASAATPIPRAITRAGVVTGTGKAAPARSVTVSGANARARGLAGAARPASPLGRHGEPAGGTLPVRPHAGARKHPVGATSPAGAPNIGRPAGTAALATKPAAAAARSSMPASGQLSGLSEGGTNCTNCPTPDVTAAVSGTQIAETVNLSMQVSSKSSGAVQCTMSLSGLVGALGALSRPRIQYDNASNRFSLVIDSVPGSSSDVPIQYLATSQTSDACGAWWVYSIVFTSSTSSEYPFGALLDYPYLGQDAASLLSSTNNYTFGCSYIGSSAYAMPKSAAYTGDGFSFTTYQVAFSTAPVTVAGIPTFATTKTYWLAAVPGTGYDLYVMPTTPAGPITLQAVVSSPFSAPTRRVLQPGTSQTLDPLDGRIESAAVQDGGFVWFAHGVNDQGFPTVRYGAINVTNNRATTALAYHSAGSDDFNPSIGVSDAGNNTNYIWVNWAYTIAANGVPVTDTVAGVGPGQGVPTLAGSDLSLARGSSTSSISTFGGYSSAEIDPVALSSSCPAGLTALTAQEYFTSSGTWTTDLAETTFC